MFKTQVYIKAGKDFQANLKAFITKVSSGKVTDPSQAVDWLNKNYASESASWKIDNGDFGLFENKTPAVPVVPPTPPAAPVVPPTPPANEPQDGEEENKTNTPVI